MTESTPHRRKFPWFLIVFAVLVLAAVVLRHYLEKFLPSLSGIAKWTSQLLIVGSAIYALFVPPYDKKRRRLSRAGVITICSILIAFAAFALSDWKDRIAAKLDGEQKQAQIKKLQGIDDSQKETLRNQSEELSGIKEVSEKQSKAATQLAEQAKAQDQLVKDAQNLLQGQGLQLQGQEKTLREQSRTLSEVGRAQQPLGIFTASAYIYIPNEDSVIRSWRQRLINSLGASFETLLLQLDVFSDPDLRPNHDSPSERVAAELLLPIQGDSTHPLHSPARYIDVRCYKKGKQRNYDPFMTHEFESSIDLRFSIAAVPRFRFSPFLLGDSGSKGERVTAILGFMDNDVKLTVLKQSDAITSQLDFPGLRVVAVLTNQDGVDEFKLETIDLKSSQNRVLRIDNFKPVRDKKGVFEATIPYNAVWR